MIHFLIYIIKSTLCLTLFYLFFKALLSRETFFRFNRFVLLAGMIVCAVLPAIEIKVSQTNAIREPVAKMENFFEASKTSNVKINPDNHSLIKSAVGISKSVESDGKTAVSASTASFPVAKTIAILYAAGFIITLVSLLVSIFKMIRIIRNGIKIRKEKYTVVCISQQICPFSWRKYIVLNENDYRQNPDEILAHESIHVRKRHSLDLLFAELFILFHWFNPVAWLLKRELQDVHEYEADREVINYGIDATKYQLLLVKKAVGARSYAIANSFNHSKIKIKNRISMMLKRKSNQWARLKLLLVVPLAVVLLQAFARPETVRIQESLINGEGTTIFKETQQSESKPDVQVKEKLNKSGKKEFILKNDSLGNDKTKNEIPAEYNSIMIKGLPKIVKRIIIKGSPYINFDENEATYSGDSIEIGLDRFIYNLKKLNQDPGLNNDSLTINLKCNSLKFNFDRLNLNLDSLKMQGLQMEDTKEWEELKKQTEYLCNYFNSDEGNDFIKQMKGIRTNLNYDSLITQALKKDLDILNDLKINKK